MSGTLATGEELVCLASSVLSLGSAVGDHKRTLYITLRKMTVKNATASMLCGSSGELECWSHLDQRPGVSVRGYLLFSHCELTSMSL